jgi:hypothetical protein
VPDSDPVNPPVDVVGPVTTKDPLIVADPVYGNIDPPPPPEPVLTVIGNVLPSPFVNVIVFRFTEAVVNSDPVFVEPPVPPFKAYEAVRAYEALTTDPP